MRVCWVRIFTLYVVEEFLTHSFRGPSLQRREPSNEDAILDGIKIGCWIAAHVGWTPPLFNQHEASSHYDGKSFTTFQLFDIQRSRQQMFSFFFSLDVVFFFPFAFSAASFPIADGEIIRNFESTPLLTFFFFSASLLSRKVYTRIDIVIFFAVLAY